MLLHVPYVYGCVQCSFSAHVLLRHVTLVSLCVNHGQYMGEYKVQSSQNEATLPQVLHKAIECVHRQCEAGVKLNKASKVPIAIQLIAYTMYSQMQTTQLALPFIEACLLASFPGPHVKRGSFACGPGNEATCLHLCYFSILKQCLLRNIKHVQSCIAVFHIREYFFQVTTYTVLACIKLGHTYTRIMHVEVRAA